ncbi:enoyl-CoA hydratase/isomerase family protein [candidate division KSB1 bacterium]|nr:enoyl-CoA hydratase/isomerase family protein [candidate division KSB1 bacterium]NIR68728.1 enoyl-CoA hydratase/isomerase family protein [candidate division KSB1 bacterium]NIS25545.1 enoyl-CoA hydratase/isomerase family protein [candidate division KSB1 bacterium]NIT72438.1 enoyl-CoA hydratase/isomerase family protein [candidate division KSB1 bacterium]NIU26222.1 enoyl-CoA hydratase/isomerase family protein [candidate division KSB1 bacterium]
MIHKESRGSVTILRMEHGKVNAIDTDLFASLIDQLQQLETAEAHAVVLTGTGGSFSAGVDLFKVVNGGKKYLDTFLPMLTDCVLKLFAFPKPVVAAVNGHAIAGGCVLVCACDYRIMAEGEGKIGVPELLVGVPFPTFPLEVMRFAVPTPHFQNLIYTGRTCTADQAKAMGLLDETTKADDLLDTAAQIAERLGAIPQDTFELTKRMLRQPTLDHAEKYKNFDPEAAKIWASTKVRENIQQYLEKTIGKR